MISNLPIKGCNDWMPNEFAKRYYIFEKWREVCTLFGYEEYLTPILENADLYRKKSGEELGGTELLVIPKDDIDMALRPEMTPSVTRMVSRIYNHVPKPIRLFSIANFYRYQKPQKGRNREFWQLNCDIFGVNSMYSDFEILQLAIEILRAFGANENNFVLLLNNRKFINFVLLQKYKIKEELIPKILSIIDKFKKLDLDTFKKELTDCYLNNDSINQIIKLCTENEFDIKPLLDEYADTTKDYSFNELLNLIEKSEYKKFIKVSPTLVRGLAYYDGIVFEIFDKKTIDNKNTNNIDVLNRSIFGGGRYNGLAELFGIKDMPAVGFAPGDETTKIFLETNNLLNISQNKNKYYLPILDINLFNDITLLGKKLRSINYIVINGTYIQSIPKALEYANKNKYTHVIIYGIDEQKQQIYIIKDLNTGKEIKYKF